MPSFFDNARRALSFCFSGSLMQRLNALQNIFVDAVFQKKSLGSFPVMPALELTNHCNLSCEMCSRHWAPLKEGEISETLLKKIEKEILPRISEISLTGYGEPMLSKSFRRTIESAKRHKVKVFFFTNATLLDEKMSEFLVKQKVDEITVSLDGATKKTFEKIRRNARFGNVIENIKRFSKIKSEKRAVLPRLRAEFVAMRQNINELQQMPALAQSLGAEELKVTHLAVFDKRFEKQSLVSFPALLHAQFEATKKTAKAAGIKLDLPIDFSSGFDAAVPACLLPWVHAYIRFDGKVQVCCWFEDAVMGDLNAQSFSEIWNNEKYKKFRELVNSSAPLKPCLGCENRFRYLKNKNFKQTYLKMRPRKK